MLVISIHTQEGPLSASLNLHRPKEIEVSVTILTRNPCSIGLTLNEMAVNDPEMHDEFTKWLSLPSHERAGGDAALWGVLDDLGYLTSLQQLGRHRRATCSCR